MDKAVFEVNLALLVVRVVSYESLAGFETVLAGHQAL